MCCRATRRQPVGAALDIGTTSNVVYLVDLLSGKVVAQAADYNGQITRGEDVISRIIYAGKNNGLDELAALVVDTINGLIEQAAQRATMEPQQIYKATVVGQHHDDAPVPGTAAASHPAGALCHGHQPAAAGAGRRTGAGHQPRGHGGLPARRGQLRRRRHHAGVRQFGHAAQRGR